jgi:hypothetical protein
MNGCMDGWMNDFKSDDVWINVCKECYKRKLSWQHAAHSPSQRKRCPVSKANLEATQHRSLIITLVFDLVVIMEATQHRSQLIVRVLM